MKQVPKTIEKIFVLYPAVQTVWIIHDLILFVKVPNLFAFTRLAFVSYLLSPAIWYLLRKIVRQETEGAFRIGKHAKGGNLWFVYYQLQMIYTHFAFFERLLKIFPGFYSAWLRMWGSKIGAKVNWTAECQIVDRGHLKIGDRAFLGNRSYLSAHAIKKVKNQYLLYVKGIVIGSDSMLSYSSHVGPGVEIGNRVMVEAGARLYLNTKIEDGVTYANV